MIVPYSTAFSSAGNCLDIVLFSRLLLLLWMLLLIIMSYYWSTLSIRHTLSRYINGQAAGTIQYTNTHTHTHLVVFNRIGHSVIRRFFEILSYCTWQFFFTKKTKMKNVMLMMMMMMMNMYLFTISRRSFLCE